MRAVAVLSVVGFHAFPGYVPAGFLGVDIFFVLSGYLITSLIIVDAAADPLSVAAFYKRRIRRLFPAALTVIAAVSLAGWWLLFSQEYARLVRHSLASMFFVENLLLASEASYFDADAASKPLLHFWSLAIEEQFYLVWPLMLIIALRRPASTKPLIVLIFLLSFGLAASGFLHQPWNFYSPFVRAWELAAGAGLALLHKRGAESRPGSPAWRDAASLLALGVVAVAVLAGSRDLPHPGWFTLAPVAATVVLLATGPDAAANRLMSLRPAVAIGLISYPLYLWHWPLLAYTVIVLDERGSTSWRAGLMVLAVVLAAATWRWVERPLRFTLPAGRAVAVLLCATAVLAAILGLSLAIRPAATDRAAAIADTQLEGVAWRYTANALCRRNHPEAGVQFCLQSGHAAPQILFVGNSYANHLVPGLMFHPALAKVPMLAFGSCELSRTDPDALLRANQCEQQLDMAEQLKSVRIVIAANQWPLFDAKGRMVDSRGADNRQSGEYPDAASYARALRATFSRLARAKVPVILVGPKPELGYDAAACESRPFRPARRTCNADRRSFERSAAPTVAILRGIARDTPGVRYFDPAPVFCDPRTCRFRAADGTPLLRDTGHFSVAGSRLVGESLVRWAQTEGIDLVGAARASAPRPPRASQGRRNDLQPHPQPIIDEGPAHAQAEAAQP